MSATQLPSVQQLARLGRLRIEAGQAARLEEQLTRLVAWFESLQAVATEGVSDAARVADASELVRGEADGVTGVPLPQGAALLGHNRPTAAEGYPVPPVLP